MKTSQRILAAAAMAMAIAAGPAIAGSVIHTAPIPSGLDADLIVCQVVNVSTKPTDVTIEILNVATGGVVVAKSGTIEPGMRDQASQLSAPGADTICRVTGISSKRAVVTYGQYDAVASKPVMTVTVP